MKKRNKILKTLSLINQIGLSILVPIFLMVFVGIFLKNKFNFDIVIICLILGILAGIRNAYMIIIGYLKSEEKDLDNESELLLKHKKLLEEKKYE